MRVCERLRVKERVRERMIEVSVWRVGWLALTTSLVIRY